MFTLPEIAGLDSHCASIRIPPELDVPLTPRVRRIMDTQPFRRLSKISQVGLVSLVYPAARHTRFEHSLGVYRLSLLFLKRLGHVSRFAEMVSKKDAERLIVTALLHDLGHWPFAHLIEDIRLRGIPHHEALAEGFLKRNEDGGELADILRNEWDVDPDSIVSLLTGAMDPNDTAGRLLASILSGPIDIDKMDYLFRDSLHAGVPYGRNLDQGRLIGSLCVNKSGDGLAITEKGKTAAELMVFARYIMFSEVYWHHAVRAATAMLQRLFRELHALEKIDFPSYFEFSETDAIDLLRKQSHGEKTADLAEGLFGSKRQIYKRVAQFSILEQPELYRKLAGRPYNELCELADRIAEELLGKNSGKNSTPSFAVLIDAPPVQKEIEIKINVHFAKDNCFHRLEDISPVVRSMAQDQFDDYTKRVRIFAHPSVADTLRKDDRVERLLQALS